MDVTEWSYREFPGKPHDGEPGYFLGYDDDDQPFASEAALSKATRG